MLNAVETRPAISAFMTVFGAVVTHDSAAHQVLLEMCKKRRNRIRQEQRRLARLRVALENMDLLSNSHDTVPTVAGSEGARAEEMITATRQ